MIDHLQHIFPTPVFNTSIHIIMLHPSMQHHHMIITLLTTPRIPSLHTAIWHHQHLQPYNHSQERQHHLIHNTVLKHPIRHFIHPSYQTPVILHQNYLFTMMPFISKQEQYEYQVYSVSNETLQECPYFTSERIHPAHFRTPATDTMIQPTSRQQQPVYTGSEYSYWKL